MDYFYVEPEVAGGLGPNSVLDPSMHPPRVSKLHYVFSGWLGDALVESFPCFIATEPMSNQVVQLGFTGVEIKDVEVSASEEFTEKYPRRKLPPFRWLNVYGTAGVDDFGVAGDLRLVVSERALRALQSLGLVHARIERLSERATT